MGAADRLLLCIRENRAHLPHQEEKRAFGGTNYREWDGRPAFDRGQATRSGLRPRASVERSYTVGCQTSNQNNHCIVRIATPTPGADKTTLPSLCHARGRLRIDGLARPASGQDVPTALKYSTESTPDPHPIGIQDGCDRNARSGISRTSYVSSSPPPSIAHYR